MPKLIINRKRAFSEYGSDFFVDIDNEKFRLKRSETKEFDLPVGNHTVTVKENSINNCTYNVEFQNDNDVTHLEISHIWRVAKKWYILIFALLVISIMFYIFNIFNFQYGRLFGAILFLIVAIFNLCINVKDYNKNNLIINEV